MKRKLYLMLLALGVLSIGFFIGATVKDADAAYPMKNLISIGNAIRNGVFSINETSGAITATEITADSVTSGGIVTSGGNLDVANQCTVEENISAGASIYANRYVKGNAGVLSDTYLYSATDVISGRDYYGRDVRATGTGYFTVGTINGAVVANVRSVAYTEGFHLWVRDTPTGDVLYTGSGGNERMAIGSGIVPLYLTAVTEVRVEALSGNISHHLSDAAGATKVTIVDSTDAVVTQIDSNGVYSTAVTDTARINMNTLHGEIQFKYEGTCPLSNAACTQGSMYMCKSAGNMRLYWCGKSGVGRLMDGSGFFSTY